MVNGDKTSGTPNSLGRLGEDTACTFLTGKGYRIITRNFRCRVGEIDIIAAKGEYVVFVEVKLRKSDTYVSAAEYVTRSKQRKIKLAAGYWLNYAEDRLGLAAEPQPRFDVIEIYAPDGAEGLLTVNHIENAFM